MLEGRHHLSVDTTGLDLLALPSQLHNSNLSSVFEQEQLLLRDHTLLCDFGNNLVSWLVFATVIAEWSPKI